MAKHNITIDGKTYDLAVTLGDIREFCKRTKGDFLGTQWSNAEALATLAELAIRPRGALTAKQIDDGLDVAGMESLLEFALATTESIAAPAVRRTANPST